MDISCEVCGANPCLLALWSDRKIFVCDKHRKYAQDAYDQDHEYDKTGLFWEKVEIDKHDTTENVKDEK